MPDRHRLKLFSHFKHLLNEESLNQSTSNSSSHGRKFLGFHIGKHDSGDSLALPTPSMEHHNHNHNHVPNSHHAPNPHHSPNPQIHSQTALPLLPQGSVADLKRLFKHKKPSNANLHPHGSGGSLSPPNAHSRDPSHTSLAALIHHTSTQLMTNSQVARKQDEESALVRKYGKVKKELGSGAGGSVRLIMRPSDSKMFAVKEFRPRRNTESFKDYTRKCTAEYCIGSTLKHPNIIKTIDIIHENNRYYEVMEYAPIDFFAVVMSGKMSRNEINCCLRQILSAVAYLHSLGLAHRDLKLDNCVLTTNGILKIIDFGSAVIFKYPYEQHASNGGDVIHNCHGVVGSDPYLAPEVLTSSNSYNPQPVDLWSVAIIYCCMTLKRFPWKIPHPDKDNSFKLYSMQDDNWHDYHLSNECHKLLLHQRHLKNLIVKLNKKKKLQQRQHDQEPGEAHHDDAPELLASVDEKLRSMDDVDILDDHATQKILAELKSIDEKLEELESVKNDLKEKFNAARDTNDPNSDSHVTSPENDQSPDEKRGKPAHKQIHGPYRLMRLLPHAARPIISKMLLVDASRRATIEEILQDEWIKEITCCTLESKSGDPADIDDDLDAILVKGSPPHDHTIVMEESKEGET